MLCMFYITKEIVQDFTGEEVVVIFIIQIDVKDVQANFSWEM